MPDDSVLSVILRNCRRDVALDFNLIRIEINNGRSVIGLDTYQKQLNQ
ncbi:hypothetical protein QZJ86_13770 [Methylomonas montana]|nr:hypothetical protein [Methylomonas montana]WKJ89087.1 hypothetical protein QZJ86_13770 [Methylomonas montana]